MLEALLTLQDTNGNTFDLNADHFKTINDEWRKGFTAGHSRAFLLTTGIAIVATAAAVGVAKGTSAFLQHRDQQISKNQE